MDPTTKLFGTKKQLEEYLGFGGFITAFLWNGLKNDVIKDQDIVKAAEAGPETKIQLCMKATHDSRIDAEKITREELNKVRGLDNG